MRNPQRTTDKLMVIHRTALTDSMCVQLLVCVVLCTEYFTVYFIRFLFLFNRLVGIHLDTIAHFSYIQLVFILYCQSLTTGWLLAGYF